MVVSGAILTLIAVVCYLSGLVFRHSDPAAGFVLVSIAIILLLLAISLVLILAICNWRTSNSPYPGPDNELPGSPPRSVYYHDLCDQLEKVEQDVAMLGNWATVAHNCAELTKARRGGKLAIIHAIEGGLQLGASPESVADHVGQLAARGVAYVTIAHLFFRRIATNAPALPFISDASYHRFAHQPETGLTPLGRAAVEAMFCNGVLIDVTHMSQLAIDDTFILLGKLEKEHGCQPVPVMATHIACRFGDYEYNLSCETIRQIGMRKGVMGVIFCDHWMHDGPRKNDPRTERRTFQIIKDNIERINCLLTGIQAKPYSCVAIGSDLDGFAKPMLRGLEHMGCMRKLQRWLRIEYRDGPGVANRILKRNALRVLHSAWGHKPCQKGEKQAKSSD
jgi:microsomal dipeptidase-like Zn-dependent dipeptidase